MSLGEMSVDRSSSCLQKMDSNILYFLNPKAQGQTGTGQKEALGR